MEVLQVSGGTKEEKYIGLASQLQSFWSGEPDLTANLANTAAAMRQTFPFHWIGFYVVKANELVLGPFQGPVACTRIGLERGVCGTAWKTKTTQLVPMWMPFRDTSPALLFPDLKLWCPFRLVERWVQLGH